MTYPLAKRLKNLGTETAFAVSLHAASIAATGKDVYPFHLGDLDIPTAKHIVDALDESIKAGHTNYAPAAGIPVLREALAEDVGNARGVKYTADNVVVQPGGKPVIPKLLNVVMNEGEGVLYPNPGYPIYESQIQYLGGVDEAYGYISTENGFKIDREQVESQIDENTRVFIYNNDQNPIGASSDDDEMQWVADLAIKHDLWVLSDEAYFDMRYSGKGKSIASLPGMQERTIILYTFSKKYAMTGWRLGAAIGPEEVIKMITKLNTNDESCTAHFIQYAGVAALKGDQTPVYNMLDILKERRDVLLNELRSIDGVKVHTPNTTFYLFPDITEVYERIGASSLEDFRIKTLEATGVSFCTREHFGTPLPEEDRKFIRFAFSGISVEKIKEAMTKLKEFWK